MIVFLCMSSSSSFRPVPLIPFLAADAALLLTAVFIAWRTPGAFTGGALLAVVVCVALGAVVAVLPWVLNDAREREEALAERQRELVALVNTSTASAARWGTQWALAATGLEDAAQLASRSIAAAERLPVVFQEKAEALGKLLSAADAEARARDERATQRTITALEELDGRVAEREVQVEARTAQITRVADEAEARLGATADALAKRLAEVEVMIGEVFAKLERVAALPEPQAVTVLEAVAMIAPVEKVVEKPKVIVSSETIMDPFLIPDDGYANLAEAMDARDA